MTEYSPTLSDISAVAACTTSPLRYVRLAFPWGKGELAGHDGPDAWQENVLNAIGEHLISPDQGRALRLAVASGHGVGKSALIAWLILWAMSTRPHLAGVVTANTRNQLKSKTWRELALWHRRAVNRSWFTMTASRIASVGHPDTWFVAALPWSKERPEAFAGLHGKHVLMLYDEASAIADPIWEVTEGAMTTSGALWFAFGNPTRTRGRFRECFGRARNRWRTFQVDARNARLASQEQIADWIADYGEDSDFVRVRVRGEFPRLGSAQFIPPALVDAARVRRDPGEGALVMGIDVARFGEDQTVFLFRQGQAVKRIQRYRGLDTMQVAARAGEEIIKRRPHAVFIDGIGVGSGVVDRLRQLGFVVCDVNAGAAAHNDRMYANRRVEMWGKMRDWLRAGGCLPHEDAALADDLSAPEFSFDSNNRIALERKQDLRARGSASPDAADALALTFAEPVWPDQPPIEPAAAGMGDYDPFRW